MRLWHKDLLPFLPRQQLVGQWRELALIAKSIKIKGTPNHILVNKVLEYPIIHLFTYTGEAYNVMLNKGYNIDLWKVGKYFPDESITYVSHEDLFSNWHNERYLTQCFYNLQEKYDCGGIPEDEWKVLTEYLYSR